MQRLPTHIIWYTSGLLISIVYKYAIVEEHNGFQLNSFAELQNIVHYGGTNAPR